MVSTQILQQVEKVGNATSGDAVMKGILTLLTMTQLLFDVILLGFSHAQKFSPFRCSFFLLSVKEEQGHNEKHHV